MTDIVKLLSDLGVDFARTELIHYKFQSLGLMDLTVETWKEGEWIHVSVAHYYLQEGDLMADPEIEFRIIQFTDFNGKLGEIQPIHYQQDGLGVYQEAMYVGENGQILIYPRLQREIKNFLSLLFSSSSNHLFHSSIDLNGLFSDTRPSCFNPIRYASFDAKWSLSL